MTTTLPIPDFLLLRNNVNITSALRNYLRSITVDDIFDSNFSPSKIELNIDPRYPGNWNLKDKLYVALFWKQYPNSYLSDDFFIDLVDDSKSIDNQSYTLSGISQDLELAETYKKDSVVYNNTTISQAISATGTALGLTTAHNATANVFLGTLPDTTQISTVTKRYGSRLEAIKDIANTYGYFANLSNKFLDILKLSSPATVTADIQIPSINRVINFQARNQVNRVSKQYNARYINRSGGNVETIIQLFNPSGVSNKIVDLSDEGIYFNFESANERVLGKLYQDYYASFIVRITYYAREFLYSGKYFYLDANYRDYEGYYIALKVVHKMDSGGWLADIEAFPIKVLSGIGVQIKTAPFLNPTLA